MNLRTIFCMLLVGASISFIQAEEREKPGMIASALRGGLEGAAAVPYIPVKIGQTVTTELERAISAIFKAAQEISPNVESGENQNAYYAGYLAGLGSIIYAMYQGVGALQAGRTAPQAPVGGFAGLSPIQKGAIGTAIVVPLASLGYILHGLANIRMR